MDKVQYWLDLCDEDVLNATAMIKGNRLLGAGFFCHLIAEKALKAAIEYNTNETPPKIHKLKKLAEKAKIFDSLSEEQLSLLDELDPLNIEARYPEYKANIALTLNAEKCKRILKETEEFLCWIKKELGR
jgi:HEPN domain-containing protein